jgi:hypothetical protein
LQAAQNKPRLVLNWFRIPIMGAARPGTLLFLLKDPAADRSRGCLPLAAQFEDCRRSLRRREAPVFVDGIDLARILGSDAGDGGRGAPVCLGG